MRPTRLAAAATARLAEAGVPSARVDAELLLAEALGIDRGRIPIADDATPEQAAAYEALIVRRAAREPGRSTRRSRRRSPALSMRTRSISSRARRVRSVHRT